MGDIRSELAKKATNTGKYKTNKINEYRRSDKSDGTGNTKSTSVCHYTGKIYTHGTFGIKYNT